MRQKVFRELLSIKEAKKKLEEKFSAQPVGVEEILLESAIGRVLGEDVEAQIDVPPFDRASMDGFAVRAEDTFGAEEERPVSLLVIGKVYAGENPVITVEDGKAVEISTGAPIPKGANAVVMVEYTWVKGNNLKIYKPVTPGENIMAAGSDIMAGELILRKGVLLTPRETGVLSALGILRVKIFKRPKVAVLSTGNEIVSSGSSLPYGKIFDINARTISDSIIECGAIPKFQGIARDDEDDLKSKIIEGLQRADMLIISGGTSAGVGDLLHRVINDVGKPGILVHGVSVKPGKPLIIAVVCEKPVFGLPGYPTSALMMFSIFVQPVIRKMGGLKADSEKRKIEARVAERIHSTFGRYEYLPVNIVRTELGDYTVYPVPGSSGAITTLSEADGFIEVSGDRNFIEEGEKVDVKLFSLELKPADLMVIGSHCVGIDLLLTLMHSNAPVKTKVVNTGSSGGLTAIRRGEADIAGIHLLDKNTGIYNISFLEKSEIHNKAVLVRGYVREQGLIVGKGNPKNIRGLEDFYKAKHLSIINRNPGSGTRILLDSLLRSMAEKKKIPFDQLISGIKGYKVEAKSHTAVAVAVLHGKADLGLGIRAVAERYGLSFLPLAYENYDFLIQRRRYEKPSIQAFLKVLRSNEFKKELRKRFLGLSPTKETGIIIYPKDFKS